MDANSLLLIVRGRMPGSKARGLKAGLRAGVASAMLLVSAAAMAEEAGQPPVANSTVPAPAPGDPGLVNTVGHWIDDSISGVASGLKGAGDSIGRATGRAGDAARSAASAVANFPRTSIVSGHVPCAPQVEGAPDCRAAVETLCRSGGFDTGYSLDTQTTRKCPAQVWLSGRKPLESECRTEAFVAKAWCQ